MELKHGKTYTCKRYRLLEYLVIDKGFECIRILPDPMNPKYKWWEFNNSPELEQAVEDYFANIERNKGA